MIFRTISADFDFWKFWPTNENFEIYEISTFSESGSKSRMRTSDSALESLNIIFSNFEILGTIWMTYVRMKQAKNAIFRKILTYFYGAHGTQNGTQNFRNFYHLKVWT